MKKTYVIKIEVTFKDAAKGTGDELVKNVERCINDLTTVSSGVVHEWDVTVKKQ